MNPTKLLAVLIGLEAELRATCIRGASRKAVTFGQAAEDILGSYLALVTAMGERGADTAHASFLVQEQLQIFGEACVNEAEAMRECLPQPEDDEDDEDDDDCDDEDSITIEIEDDDSPIPFRLLPRDLPETD